VRGYAMGGRGRLGTRLALVAGVALTTLVSGLAPPSRAQDQRGEPSVTGAVQVTQNPDPNRAHSTPQMAVNPKTGEIVIGEAEVRTQRTCNIHISVDGGRSWFRGGDPMLRPFTDCSQQATNGPYITFEFDPRGVLWAAFFASDPKWITAVNRNDAPRNIYLARSEDSGRTWRTTRVYEGKEGDPGIGASRRAQIAVDPRDPQRVYVGWQKGGFSTPAPGGPRKAMISASRDAGASFAQPVELQDGRGGGQPRPVVDDDGIVHVVFAADQFGAPPAPAEPPIRPLIYRRSSDGGVTWSPIREIDPGNATFSFMRKQMIAADREAGILYTTWYGNANPRARRPAAGQPSTDEFDDREIFLKASYDNGRTWSESRVVNDDAGRRNIQHYDSGISVAPDGRLDIAWYDFRNSPVPEGEEAGGNGGGWQDVYYAYSTDGGRTFSKNLRVTDRIMDRTIGVWSNNVHSHTNIAIASGQDAAYIAWQDTRNGNATLQAEDIYFAAVRFPVEEEGEGAPGWVVLGAAAAIGLGLTLAVGAVLNRRRRA
jgi:hypothetical protein